MVLIQHEGAAQVFDSRQIDVRLIENGEFNFPVTNVVQDQKGTLWIGSVIGLYRFDGLRSFSYSVSPVDSSFLPDQYINPGAMAIADTVLWIGTRTGLYRLNITSGSFSDIAWPDGANEASIESVHVEPDGTLLIGYRGGVMRYDPANEDFQSFQLKPARDETYAEARNAVLSVTRDVDGIVWAATLYGLLRCNSDDKDCIPEQSSNNGVNLSTAAFRSMIASRTGPIYLGTDQGQLIKFDPATGDSDAIDIKSARHMGAPSVYVAGLYEDEGQRVWAGMINGGVAIYEDKTGRLDIYPPENFGDNESAMTSPVAFLRDKSGVFWLASWNGLIRQRTYLPFEQHGISISGQLTFPPVEALAITGNNNLLAGSASGIIAGKKDGTTSAETSHALDVYSQLSSSIVSDLYPGNGYVLIATANNGIWRFDDTDQSVSPVLQSINANDNLYYSVYEDSKGRIWAGNAINSLWVRPDTLSAFVQVESKPGQRGALQSSEITTVREDTAGRLWVGTLGGGVSRLVSIDDDAGNAVFETYLAGSGVRSLSSNNILALYEDEAGQLWVGTMGGGLNRWDEVSDSFVRYGREAGILDRNITCIVSDQQGDIWAGSQNGLFRLDPETSKAVRFGEEDGLASRVVNIGACVRDQEGNLHFGTEAGVVSFSPGTVRTGKKPDVYLSQFYVNNAVYEGEVSTPYLSAVRLEHEQNFLSFHLASNDLHDAEKNQFAVYLEGLDTDWGLFSTDAEVDYTALPPGTYRLKAQTLNSYLASSEVAELLTIEIIPPYWEQAWFRWLAAVLIGGPLIGLVGVISYHRYAILRFKRNELEVQIQKQTKSLQLANQRMQDQARLLRKKADQLREADAIKSRYFANVSHEFRTPLQLIIEPIRLLLKDSGGALSVTEKEDLKRVTQYGHKLLRLVDQLLDLTRMQNQKLPLHLQRINIGQYLNAIIGLFEALAKKKGVLLSFHGSKTFWADVDPEKIQDIMENLVSNAIKFSNDSGRVEITLEQDAADMLIVVADEGVGIPEHDVPHIFEPYFRASSPDRLWADGSGVGLAYVKELVQLHQGTIVVESEEGKGSCFTLRFPRLVLDEEEIDEERSNKQPVPGLHLDGYLVDYAVPRYTTKREKSSEVNGSPRPEVLVVEDNIDVLNLLNRVLSPEYTVIHAHNGKEALQLLERGHPELVISDIMMPEMDGLQLCQYIKSEPSLRFVPVMLLTAKGSAEERTAGVNIGADDYLGKPWQTEELLARANRLIVSRRLFREKYGKEIVINPGKIEITSEEAQFVERLVDLMERHVDNNTFGVEQLADAMEMNRSTLGRKMRDTLETTPKQFMRTFRMKRAMQLLRGNAGTVQHIAQEVGYRDVEYFARLFKEHYGKPPSEFREVDETGQVA